MKHSINTVQIETENWIMDMMVKQRTQYRTEHRQHVQILFYTSLEN